MVKIKTWDLRVVWTDGVEENVRVPDWGMSLIDLFLSDLEEARNWRTGKDGDE